MICISRTGLISQQSQNICIQHVLDVHTCGSGDDSLTVTSILFSGEKEVKF